MPTEFVRMDRSTSKSLLWSSLDKFGVQVFALIVGIFTTRMLSPDDFGVIAALAIFTALSNVLVDSGVSAALIRRESNTEEEYAAAFLFNLGLSIVLYFALWGASGSIASYYEMEEINPLSKFVFLAIVINSFGIIQTVRLTREMRFKEMSIANLVSAVGSAMLTIFLVLRGYTYWAIAWQQVSLVAIRVVMLWIMGGWLPSSRPDFSVIRKIFSFSIFLLLTSTLNIIVKYIYNFKIPKIYPQEQLGYYDRSRKFQEIPSAVVTGAVGSVAYPILSKLNSDSKAQLAFFRKIVRVNAFLIFPMMIGLISVIDNLTVVVLTAKWLPMIPYFQILCLAAIFTPFQTLCLTTLNAMGKSSLNMWLEIGRNLLTLLLFFVFSATIYQMLWGFSLAMFVSYVVNMIVVGSRLRYSLFDHIKDIFPYLAISLAMAIVCLFVGKVELTVLPIKIRLITALLLQILIGFGFYVGVSYMLGSKVISDCLELIFKKKR